MRRFLLLIMCVTVLAGCGAEENEVTTSVLPTSTIEESRETVAAVIPEPTLTPETTNEEPALNLDRYPAERVIIEASEEDKAGWTSTVHFTEPDDKYFSMTYNDEKLCFDREQDKMYGSDVITNIGQFINGNQTFDISCYVLKEKSAWEWAQENPDDYEYVASYPRKSGSIEVYWWNDYNYQIYYELNDFEQGGLYFRYGVLKEDLERSSFESLDELIACIGEVTVTPGKFDYELPYLETYEIMEVDSPFDMYVSVRNVMVFDRPNTSNAYYAGMLERNDIVTVTGIVENSSMYRVLSDGKEVYIDERFLTAEYVRDRRDILAESWKKYKADFKPIREGEAGYKRGDELHFSSSLILPYSHFEIPVLDQFNTIGLLNEDRVGIFGYVYPTTGIYKWSPPPPGEETSENVVVNFDLYVDAIEALRWEWADQDIFSESSQGFLVGGSQMQWYTGSFGERPDVELVQPLEGEGYYTLTIRYPLDAKIGEELGMTMSEDVVKAAREALIVYLSCVSSTPMEIYDSLLYNLYYAPDGEETLSENWTVVGDSQIRVSFEESSQKRHIWNFHIKSK